MNSLPEISYKMCKKCCCFIPRSMIFQHSTICGQKSEPQPDVDQCLIQNQIKILVRKLNFFSFLANFLNRKLHRLFGFDNLSDLPKLPDPPILPAYAKLPEILNFLLHPRPAICRKLRRPVLGPFANFAIEILETKPVTSSPNTWTNTDFIAGRIYFERTKNRSLRIIDWKVPDANQWIACWWITIIFWWSKRIVAFALQLTKDGNDRRMKIDQRVRMVLDVEGLLGDNEW